MLYYAGAIVNPENRKIEPTGKEAAHALEPLVESGVRIAVRLRPDLDFPVDGALSGGYDHPQGSAGGHQHRAGTGLGAGLPTTGSWTFFHSPALDRKSTRLNSSHRCISYAVFCL